MPSVTCHHCSMRRLPGLRAFVADLAVRTLIGRGTGPRLIECACSDTGDIIRVDSAYYWRWPEGTARRLLLLDVEAAVGPVHVLRGDCGHATASGALRGGLLAVRCREGPTGSDSTLRLTMDWSVNFNGLEARRRTVPDCLVVPEMLALPVGLLRSGMLVAKSRPSLRLDLGSAQQVLCVGFLRTMADEQSFAQAVLMRGPSVRAITQIRSGGLLYASASATQMLTATELADMASALAECTSYLGEVTAMPDVCRPVLVSAMDAQPRAFASRGCAVVIDVDDVRLLRASRGVGLANILGQLAGAWCGTGVPLSGAAHRRIRRGLRAGLALLCLEHLDPALRRRAEAHLAASARLATLRANLPQSVEHMRVAKLGLRTFAALRYKPDRMTTVWRRHWMRSVNARVLLRELMGTSA